MSDKCERCRKGYPGAPPRDDVEWLTARGPLRNAGDEELRIARCTRCGSYLLDRASAAREGAESHDLCVVHHEAARAALIERQPAALAAVSPQIRRRHLERLVATMPTTERATLERIERGAIECTETFRGLATRALAHASDLPPPPASHRLLQDAAVAARGSLDLGDGSRVLLDLSRARPTLLRMRGDAVEWRTELPAAGREGFVARVAGHKAPELVVVVGPAGGEAACSLFLVHGSDGRVRGPGKPALRAAAFEAHALPGGCVFVATFQRFAVIREDASVAYEGSSSGFPVAVPVERGAVVVDAPWRLLALDLPAGSERWTMPVDRGAALAPAGEGHVLLITNDAVARLEVRGPRPRLVWTASGISALPLAGGGAALVRERWEKSVRRVECVLFDAEGRRLFTVPRPEATKVPFAELGPGVLLYKSNSDVAVSVRDRVVYALASPEGKQVNVTVDQGGAWIEYDGVLDRVDRAGNRAGRYRIPR